MAMMIVVVGSPPVGGAVGTGATVLVGVGVAVRVIGTVVTVAVVVVKGTLV